MAKNKKKITNSNRDNDIVRNTIQTTINKSIKTSLKTEQGTRIILYILLTLFFLLMSITGKPLLVTGEVISDQWRYISVLVAAVTFITAAVQPYSNLKAEPQKTDEVVPQIELPIKSNDLILQEMSSKIVDTIIQTYNTKHAEITPHDIYRRLHSAGIINEKDYLILNEFLLNKQR